MPKSTNLFRRLYERAEAEEAQQMKSPNEGLQKAIGCFCETGNLDTLIDNLDQQGWIPQYCPMCGRRLEVE